MLYFPAATALVLAVVVASENSATACPEPFWTNFTPRVDMAISEGLLTIAKTPPVGVTLRLPVGDVLA